MAFSDRTAGAILLTAGIVAGGLMYRENQKRQAEEALKAAQAAQEEAAAKAAAVAATPAAQVISLWTGQPVPGEPMGVHVADVSVDAAGSVSVMLADTPKTRAAVEAAIAGARAQPALPLPVSSSSAAGMPPEAARPGDPRYAEAVAQFLAAQTGYTPQISR
jgi:hypothetical protein